MQDTLAIAVGGRAAGTYYQGDRRFDIVVRLPESVREHSALRKLPIALPKADGQAQTAYIPLSEVASLDLSPGPNQVSRENGKRRIVISANVRGRDLGSFVSEAAEAIERDVKIPAGYWTTWGGTFEQLQSAAQRLQIVVPAALVLVFALLFAMFGNVKDGLLVFTGIPFALTGGIISLWLRGMPLSITAAVGFIALCGVAVLNGLVMLSFINGLRQEGKPLDEAVREADAAAAGADDGAGGLAGLRAHGPRHRHRRRGAAPAGHRGDRRHHLVDHPDPAGAARAVPPAAPQGRRGAGTGRISPRGPRQRMRPGAAAHPGPPRLTEM